MYGEFYSSEVNLRSFIFSHHNNVITVILRVVHYTILSINVHLEHRLPSIVWHSEELMISTFTTLLSVTTGTIWSQHESQSIRHRAIRSLSLVPLRAYSNNVNCNWRSCDVHRTRVHYIIKRWWLFSVTRFSASKTESGIVWST